MMNPKTEAQMTRVAAYGRFSTMEGNDYTTRRGYYSDMITRNPGWTFTGMYADEGRGGRQFNEMMADAENGRIDYIITKSISRFAGNTADTVSCVRKLKELNPPVGVFFETENLNSLDVMGEMVLAILSDIAQDEAAGEAAGQEQ